MTGHAGIGTVMDGRGEAPVTSYAIAFAMFEELPSAETLQVVMMARARDGDPLHAIRTHAVQLARQFGIWDYVAPKFRHLLTQAVAAQAEARCLELQPHQGA